jgi:hypothetical protein
MVTFTLSVIGYLDPLPKQAELKFEQLKLVLQQHRELYPWRVKQALAWAAQASPGQHWQTNTDLQESDQADIYLTCD